MRGALTKNVWSDIKIADTSLSTVDDVNGGLWIFNNNADRALTLVSYISDSELTGDRVRESELSLKCVRSENEELEISEVLETLVNEGRQKKKKRTESG